MTNSIGHIIKRWPGTNSLESREGTCVDPKRNTIVEKKVPNAKEHEILGPQESGEQKSGP